MAKSQDRNSNASQNAASDHVDSDGQRKWEQDPIVFSVRDRNIIRNYYRSNDLQLTGQSGTPSPSLKQRLQRNATFPINLQALFEPLMPNLESRLQPLNSNYARGLIGKDVVIIENRSRRIKDIVRNVTGGTQLPAKI